MDFKVEKSAHVNLKNYHKEELDLALEFAKQAYKEFGAFLKVVAIFGSLARKEKKVGDIDILFIIDDVSIVLTPEVVETYRIITERLVSRISPRIHVTSLRLTSFWEYLRNGDPIAINMLRDGVPLIDTGFFEPFQKLLYQGRIRPTMESIYAYFSRAPRTLHSSKMHFLQATLDLYWAVIDSAHAALMKQGNIPPSPEHVADLMHESLVKPRLLEERYVTTMRNFYDIMKGILHRDIREITAQQYMHYYKEAEDFVKRMEQFLEQN
jgi:predicted nucleotidyltransferase/uncharacterized protein (UPF0332 family)